MREIVLDTETTGLDPTAGHRVIEIGCVELLNHIPSGRVWHRYINPRRDVPREAYDVHGLSAEFLADKPEFGAVAPDFLDFIDGARLIIHNASFDIGFLNAELESADRPSIAFNRVIDTLALARRRHPGAPNGLDDLCRRYGIDNSRRDKHGALLDAELLAEVYIELIGGRQAVLGLVEAAPISMQSERVIRLRPAPLPPRLSEADIAAYEADRRTLER
jgi:DNA polymerase III subunit epsilon